MHINIYSDTFGIITLNSELVLLLVEFVCWFSKIRFWNIYPFSSGRLPYQAFI